MKKRKFTLIELIAVIIILGIIAVTAIPKYYDLKEKAELATADGVFGAAQSAVALNWSAWLAGDENVAAPIQTGTELLAEMEGVDLTQWDSGDNSITWQLPNGVAYVINVTLSTTTDYNGKYKVVLTKGDGYPE